VKAAANSTPSFSDAGRKWSSLLGSGLTALATYLIIAILFVIVGHIIIEGLPRLSWQFVSSGIENGMFNVDKSGILPMIVGTASRVILMTIFVIPIGVITAIYMTEYAHTTSLIIRVIRGAVSNLAGVPSVIFGLFGLGFFISFVGKNVDAIFNPASGQPVWGKGGLLWASMTLAVMTLPVVIVTTEEALKAIPQGLREASLALGATKLQTIRRIVLPQAMPGIMTGGILAVSRAAGEVAPIIFTGAAYAIPGLPKALYDQFMDLGYHVYILSTQSPNIDQTRPLLQATVLVLLMLTFTLNIVAVLIRTRMRKKMRLLQ
jgi:phosphate transport system permease protein